MKKTISVLLMLVVVLSLCACGTTNKTENNGIEKDYIGTWKTSDGETVFCIYEGGAGYYNSTSNKYSFTWEIKGNSLLTDDGEDKMVYNVDKSQTPHKLTSPTITIEYYRAD